MSIAEYLYQKKPKADTTGEDIPPFPATLSHTKSESMLRRRRENKYQELYSLLKPADEELLTSGNIQESAVPEKALFVLKPLLEELQSLQESLSYQDFASSMDNLMDILTPSEKALILGVQKQVEKPATPSFQPAINRYKPQRKEMEGLSGLYERETARRKVSVPLAT